MFSITLKLMKKSARMLIPAGVAILIGTAFICVTFLFSNTMNDALARQQTATYGEANYIVMTDDDTLNAASQQEKEDAWNRTVSDFQLDRIRAINGVTGVRADVNVNGLIVSHNDKHISGFAVVTSDDAKLLPVRVTDGNQPIDNNEIALPQSVAAQLNVQIGDTVSVDSRAAQYAAQSDKNVDASSAVQSGESAKSSSAMQVRIVGLTDDPNGVAAYYGGASIVSDNVAAAMNGIADFAQVSTSQLFFDLAGVGESNEGNAQAKATAAHIAKLLPKYYTIMSRDVANQKAVASLSADNGTDIVTTFLLSFGVLAMFVAALVIANTFQVLVAQRRRTLALLRTIGATKSQLYGSVLWEAGVLGLIASALGVALGCALIAGLCVSGLLASTGMTPRFVPSWQSFVIPILFGIVMTILASLNSARSATVVTPLEALRPIEFTDTKRAGRVRAVVSAVLIIAGVALAVFAARQMMEHTAGRTSMVDNAYAIVLLMAIIGCAFIFLGLVLSGIFWLPILMRVIGALVALSGPSAKVAHANIQKNPRRVAATGAALLIGVTLVATIATGAASGKQTMNEALDSRYSVDMIADGASISDKQATEASKVKGVSASVYAPTAVRYATTKNGNEIGVLLVGVDDVHALRSVMKADLGDVTIGENDVLMPKYDAFGKPIAFKQSNVTFNTWTPSDSDSADVTDSASTSDATNANATQDTPLTFTPKQIDYRRVSIVYDAVAFINAEHFTNGDLTASSHILLMRVNADAAGISLNDVLTNVQNVFSGSTGVSVTGPVAERSIWETNINGMMALLVGLIAVAVLIALVGVANTLSLSVIERTRESATLRAIGMTRGQLRRSLAVEALLLSLVSGVAGVVIGTLFGWLGSYMVFGLYGTVVFPFDWVSNGIMLAVAAVAALIASIAPAHRAVGVPPVEALAEA